MSIFSRILELFTPRSSKHDEIAVKKSTEMLASNSVEKPIVSVSDSEIVNENNDSSLKSFSEVDNEFNNANNSVDENVVDYDKNDLECMKKVCDLKIANMAKNGKVASPYFFERVAILAKKSKDYKLEIFYCELYITKVKEFYRKKGKGTYSDVRKGARYQAIVNRLPKAKAMLSKR